MATLFTSTFETGNTSEWDEATGTYAIVGSPVHHGSYAFKSTVNGRLEDYGTTNVADVYYRFYFRIDDVTNSAMLGWIYNVAWSQFVTFGVNGGAFWLTCPSGTYTGGSPAINTWYCVEVRRKVGAGNGIATLYANGVSTITRTTETITGNSANYKLGIDNAVSGSVIGYFDCVLIADAYIGTEAAAGQQLFTLINEMGY